MSMFLLYMFLVLLPNLGCLFSVSAVVVSLSAILGGITEFLDEKNIMALFILAFFLGFLSCFSPDSTQIYALAGAYTVTNTNDISKLPDNLVKAANAWLDNAAKEAAKKAIGEKK